ncbi:MAG: hypothetical protein ABJA34_02775 [Pseudonocardiales bacterium]
MRSGRFVAWSRAWQAGLVSYDEALDATQDGGRSDEVSGCVGPGMLGDFFLLARAQRPRLVLPVPGDPRGLPGPGPFTDAALAAGQAVVAGRWGLVPEFDSPAVVWRSYELPVVAPDLVCLPDADYELSEAVRETAAALSRLEVARMPPGLFGALAALRRLAEEVALPPGYPARAHRLIARADRVGTILRLAGENALGAAVDGRTAVLREDLLRSVSTSVRRARLASYNADLLT